MIRRPPRSTRVRSSAASDVYKRQPTYRTRGPRREAAPTPPPGRWPACTSRGWPDILQKQVRPGGLIRKCVPQETGIGTRTGCHVKWKPHAKSSPGFCNTKTGARCRQQPAYENRQAAIWKHLRARQRPAKIPDIGKPNVPKHSNPCLLYTSPSPRDATLSRMPSSA